MTGKARKVEYKVVQKKRIFEFDNYRTYLRYFYETSKEENAKFSLRYFSNLAGFKSHSVLRQVIEGQRNISVSSIAKFIKALKLNKEESEFFRNLVMFNQASTSEEKQKLAEIILNNRGYKLFHSPLKAAQYNYFSHWYFIVIREMVGLPGFKDDPEWIAKQISPAIPVRDVKIALEELFNLGLIVRDGNGRVSQSEAHLETPDEVISASFANCHKELLKRASESIDRIPRQMRDISGVTFGMSEATVKLIKEKIHTFRKEIVEIASHDQDPNAVYQLNLQLFPLARLDDQGNEEK